MLEFKFINLLLEIEEKSYHTMNEIYVLLSLGWDKAS